VNAPAPRPARTAKCESGLTLVELLLYMGLSVVVLVVAGAMLVSSTRAQTQVSGATSASTAGQLIMRSIETGVRNASQVDLPATTASGTQLLTVRTQDGETPVQWSCQAWYFTPDAGGGSLYTRRMPATTAIPSPAGGLSSWTLLGAGVSVSGAPVFTRSAGLVTVSLSVRAGSGSPIPMKSVSNTLNLVTSGAPCF
jgi:type II secretory pathway pseudopilin PulG